MSESSPSTPRWTGSWIESCLLAALALLPWVILETPRGLGLSDEGSLWFLTYETARGGVPVLDHRFYDPGRYFLFAPFVWIFGDGIMAVRWGGVVYVWAAMVLALRAAGETVSHRARRGVLAVALSLWLFPLHKFIDHAVLLAAVFVMTRVVLRPTRGSSFAAGVLAGVAAFIGRNHGMYLVAAYVGIQMALWLARASTTTGARVSMANRLAAFAAGIVLGLLPLWGLLLLQPGFADAYVDFVRQSTVALGKPVPWPWAVAYTRYDWLLSAFNLVVGCLFVWLLLFPALAAWRLWNRFDAARPGDALLLACAALGLGYLPQAFGRPDVSHLAQAIHPAIIGVFPLVASAPRRALLGALTMAGILLAGGVADVYKRLAVQEWRDPQPWVEVEVAGDNLRLSPQSAAYLDRVRQTLERAFPGGRSSGRVYLGPYRAGLYRVLGWDSPCWDSGWPHAIGERQQRGMIAQMEEAQLLGALVWMRAVDGREDLRFDHTHPLVWEYFQTHFVATEVPELPEHLTFVRQDGAAPPGTESTP